MAVGAHGRGRWTDREEALASKAETARMIASERTQVGGWTIPCRVIVHSEGGPHSSIIITINGAGVAGGSGGVAGEHGRVPGGEPHAPRALRQAHHVQSQPPRSVAITEAIQTSLCCVHDDG
jgi:hypothetical protein